MQLAVATIYEDGLNIGKTVSVMGYNHAYELIEKWAKKFCKHKFTKKDRIDLEINNYWCTNYGNGQEIAFQIIGIEDE